MPSPYGGAGDNNKEMLTTLDINYRLPGRVAAVDDHAVRDPRDDQRYEKRGDDLDARVDLQRSLGDVGYAAVATTEADGVDVCPGEFTVDSRLLPPARCCPVVSRSGAETTSTATFIGVQQTVNIEP